MNKQLNHHVYEALLEQLIELGHNFGRCTEVTETGKHITTSLCREEQYFGVHADDYVQHLKDILPTQVSVWFDKQDRCVYLYNVPFAVHQIEHYEQRLKESTSPAEKSFLRATLHGLKKAV